MLNSEICRKPMYANSAIVPNLQYIIIDFSLQNFVSILATTLLVGEIFGLTGLLSVPFHRLRCDFC